MKRLLWLVLSVMVVSLVVTGVSLLPPGTLSGWGTQTPIRVGVLHSLTGTMAVSEKAVVQAVLLAVDEINQAGGVLGRPVETLVVDGASDWPTFAREARRLIRSEKVSVIFGCWTSASRKTVKPVVEEFDHLLFYPVQYEGLEQSPNIVYTGASPNQQIVPGVKWAFDNLGKRFFLVGSDYVFPRMANRIIKDQVKALGGTVVGEEYVLLGSSDMESVVWKIRANRPDVILNTINGDSNGAFFRELRAADITPDDIPSVSFSLTEGELDTLGHLNMVGDYAVWNYFQSIDTDENRRFVDRFKETWGRDRVVGDPMEAAYFGVHLWKQAVEEAGTDDPAQVRKRIANQSFQAAEGLVYVDPENQHTWKNVRIGQVRPDGQFEIVWTSGNPVHPTPYPPHRSRSEWHQMMDNLYTGWGGHWANPGEAVRND